MTKTTNTTKIYASASSAKGRVTSLNKAAGSITHTMKEVEGGWIVVRVEAPKAPKAPKARTTYSWLPALVARLKEVGATRENLVQSATPKRQRLTLNGKTVAWFTQQEYIDATLAAL